MSASSLARRVQVPRAKRIVPPAELANYCLHALNAAASLPSEAAVSRLVTITVTGLRRPREAASRH